MRRHLPLVFALLCCACRDAPTSPSAASSPSAALPTPVTTVRGVVVDGDRDQPVGEAFVKVVAMGVRGVGREVSQPGWSARTDGNGVFGFAADLPPDWSYLILEAVRPGYESSRTHVESDGAASVVLKVQPTLIIHVGESLETRIIYSSGSTCFFPCRRAFVEAPPGDLVDIEVTTEDSEATVGLQVELKPFSSTYQRRITVSSGEFWIVGDEPRPFVPVRLTATRH